MPAAAFDPVILFEEELTIEDRFADNRPYEGSLELELDAVQSRRKGMSYQSRRRTDLDSDEFLAIVRMVLDRGLALVIDPDGDEWMRAFMLHPEEAWRVPAFRAL